MMVRLAAERAAQVEQQQATAGAPLEQQQPKRSRKGPTPNAPNAGRPVKEIDWGRFDALCSVACTLEEVASYFKLDENTIEARIREKFDCTFSVVQKRLSANVRQSLRRAQIKSALEGNVTSQIWMGKQLLGQRDRFDTEVSGKNGGAIRHEVDDLRNASVDEVEQIVRAAQEAVQWAKEAEARAAATSKQN